MTYRKLNRCKGSGKVMYEDRANALAAADYLKAIGQTLGRPLFAYRCPQCQAWHLTKNPQRNRRRDQEQTS